MMQITRAFGIPIFFLVLLVLLSSYAVATDVTDCASGQIGVSGDYAVINNITADADPCIYITASDVIIDGGGYTLNGPGGILSGIYVETGTSNVTIRNFSITGFDWYPISTFQASNIVVSNNYIASSPSFDGILLEQTIDSFIEYNTLSMGGSGRGIDLTNSVNVSVRYNNITSTNSFGLWLFSSDSQDNLIEGNNITSTNSFSIVAWTTPNNRFVNNLVNSPNGQDIRIYSGSTGTTFTSLVINNTINISFSQDGGTAIGDAVPITPPSGLVNVGTGKYLNITNYTAAWMFLNISYNDDELDLINESSLKIWRWNGTVWNDTGFADIVGVDEANNIVYANIINFSVFGAFGQPLVPGINITVNSTSATIVVNVNASYLVTIGNNGTAAGTYNLTVQNLTAASDVMALNQSNITLAAGATGSVLLSVGNGAAGEFNVTVIASLSTNASINATTPVITTTVQAAAPPPTAWYPTSSQSCTRRSLNCANWSACIEQGVQNRTCTYSTAACTLEPVNETQNCIYTSPVPPFAPPCTEDWRCDDWSACTDNEQERSCADRNACNTTVNKLAESQACIMPVPLVGPVCGDGTCESGEDYETCPADCVMPVPAPALPELDVIAIMTISMIVAIAGFGLAVRSMLRKRTKRRFKRKPIKQRYAFSLPR